jgi:hypothetical protein
MAASGDWDPAAVLAPGSSAGHRSWDPGSSAEELPSSCRACGFDRSVTSSRGSPGSGATITGGEVRYLLSS